MADSTTENDLQQVFSEIDNFLSRVEQMNVLTS